MPGLEVCHALLLEGRFGLASAVAPAWPTWPHTGYVVVEDGRVEVRLVQGQA